jgi:hypothetical protein
MDGKLNHHGWVTRRDALCVGGLTTLGLGLTDLVRLRNATAAEPGDRTTRHAKNCVVIWLDGGPSHLETFDLKPDAPKEVRGPLQATSTAIPGISMSECLPQLAKRMQDIAVVRSMTSPLGEHNFGTHYLLTGYRPTPVVEYPSFSSATAFVRGDTGDLPSHVGVPTYRVGGAKFSGHGFLPARVAPFSLGADPSKAGFKVKDLDAWQGLESTRLARRRDFVKRLNTFSDELNSSAIPKAAESDEFAQAWRLISSTAAREAFQLEDESNETRNRYGRKTVGQSCLLARRLIERGVPFVTVNHRGWDTHNDLVTRLKDGYTGARKPVGLIPSLDLAMSGLIDDLKERGLFEETLIVVMGEFGRTPKLNTQGGRDHWPRVFSVALAGGGIRGGQTIGTSDSRGESPLDRPVTPGDLTRTLYTLLGVDPDATLKTADGRPVRLAPEGSSAIKELLG